MVAAKMNANHGDDLKMDLKIWTVTALFVMVSTALIGALCLVHKSLM